MALLTTRDIIRMIIEQHQNVINSGGISNRSSLYCTLIRRQRLLLQKFQLPFTQENLLATVSYPLCQPVSSILAAALCDNPDGYVHQTEFSRIFGVSGTLIKLGEGLLMDSQVEYVYGNLKRLAKQFKNS
jgi:hypothetical protein